MFKKILQLFGFKKENVDARTFNEVIAEIRASEVIDQLPRVDLVRPVTLTTTTNLSDMTWESVTATVAAPGNVTSGYVDELAQIQSKGRVRKSPAKVKVVEMTADAVVTKKATKKAVKKVTAKTARTPIKSKKAPPIEPVKTLTREKNSLASLAGAAASDNDK